MATASRSAVNMGRAMCSIDMRAIAETVGARSSMGTPQPAASSQQHSPPPHEKPTTTSAST
eukprot:1608415-Prymnesium_polylepis.1